MWGNRRNGRGGMVDIPGSIGFGRRKCISGWRTLSKSAKLTCRSQEGPPYARRESPRWHDEASIPDEYVVVRFVSPVEGTDPDDSERFTSNRHKVAARWARQDATEATFIDDFGEIVARWPTLLILSIAWPDLAPPGAGRSIAKKPNRTLKPGTLEWRDKVKRQFPMAYERWSETEDADLQQEFANGRTVEQMSTHHQRRHGGIMARLVGLGLIRPDTSQGDVGRNSA